MTDSLPSTLRGAVKVLRPKQWTKNALLFAALMFSPGSLDLRSFLLALGGFAVFCALSSTGYILNDYLDREADRKHPKKRFRPIASGSLPPRLALVEMVVLFCVGVSGALFLSPMFLAIAGLYLATTVSYSLYWKHKVILDVMVLAMCYVLRAVAGAIAIGVHVSEWLFLCTAFLALFIGLNKRRAELVQLGSGTSTRKILGEYSLAMLEQYQAVTTGSVVICYALYTVFGPTQWLMLTVPFVLFGVFRYIYLVEQKGEGGAPDETFLKDVPILLTVLLYAALAGGLMQLVHHGILPEWPTRPAR